MLSSALAGAGVSTLSPTGQLGPQASPPARVISPNSYAQERVVLSEAPTVVWSSAVGKGKSTGACMNAFAAGLAGEGIPIALTRLERASMNESTIQSLQKMVGPELWGLGWRPSTSTFYFPRVKGTDGVIRQSRIVCFGWLDPGRALSTEFDRIIVDQAEQLERDHYSIAQTRLRFFDRYCEARLKAAGLRPRQMVLICNADDPEHWLNQEFAIEEKGMRLEWDGQKPAFEVLLSGANDNEENLTEDYRARRESLRGTIWYDRLVGGRWLRAEGLVYGQAFDPAENVIDRPESWGKWYGYPPPNQPRHRSFDFGVNHPFVCLWFAEQPDGRLICYRELRGTGRAPSEWAEQIAKLEAAELKMLRYGCEDEAEARAMMPRLRRYSVESSPSDTEKGWRLELERAGVWTQPAEKDIKGMIGAMTSMLRERKLLFVRDLLVDEDPRLVRDKQPVSILQEFGRYRWPKRKPAGESSDERFDVPVDRDNHGLDACGYMVVAYRHQRTIGIWG